MDKTGKFNGDALLSRLFFFYMKFLFAAVIVQKHCYIIEEQEDLLVIATCMLAEWVVTGGTVDRY